MKHKYYFLTLTMTITFITGNKNKFLAAEEVAKSFNVTIIQEDVSELPEIQSLNPEEVIKAKIQFIIDNKLCSGIFILDDASFIINSIYTDNNSIVPSQNWPGPFMKFYLKEFGENGIVQMSGGSSAKEIIYLAYFDTNKPDDGIKYIKTVVQGKIAINLCDGDGFGYDHIFIPDTTDDKAYSELTIDEKKVIQGRWIGFKKLFQFMNHADSA